MFLLVLLSFSLFRYVFLSTLDVAGMNYYHFPSANLWKEGEPYGVKPHMDSGIFTLLLTDGTDGLERCVNRRVS